MKKITKFSRDSRASAQTRYCVLCTAWDIVMITLIEIISYYLDVRIYFEHKDNARGHMADFMRRIRREKIGKIN